MRGPPVPFGSSIGTDEGCQLLRMFSYLVHAPCPCSYCRSPSNERHITTQLDDAPLNKSNLNMSSSLLARCTLVLIPTGTWTPMSSSECPPQCSSELCMLLFSIIPIPAVCHTVTIRSCSSSGTFQTETYCPRGYHRSAMDQELRNETRTGFAPTTPTLALATALSALLPSTCWPRP